MTPTFRLMFWNIVLYLKCQQTKKGGKKGQEKNRKDLVRTLKLSKLSPSSLVSCLLASCLSSSGLWAYKVGSRPSFQIHSKEGDSTFVSEYVSHVSGPFFNGGERLTLDTRFTGPAQRHRATATGILWATVRLDVNILIHHNSVL